MATLYNQKDKNVRKTWLLMTLFFIIIIFVGWTFSYIYNSPEVLVFAVLFSIFMNIIGYWYSDKIVIKLSGAQPATREEFRDLYNIVENLSITAGLPMPQLYVIPDPVPNAFATGRNKEHAAVAVTTGLLQILNRTELEGVIAHELSHVGNRDTLLSTVVVVLVGFIVLLSDFFRRMSFFGGRGRDNDRGGGIIIIVGIILSLLAPLIATLIQLAISRKREFLADDSGALLTRYPEGLASALEKIGAYSGEMRRANNAIAHLYISNPFGRDKLQKTGNFLSKLFSTHPPIEERVRILRGEAK